MYVPKTSKGFLKYVNCIDLTDEEQELIEDYKRKCEGEERSNHNNIFSILKYLGDNLGFVELIYCFKKQTNKPSQFQQIMAVSEKYGVYGKNCYYQEYGCARGFHVFFNKKGINSWYNVEKYSDSLIVYHVSMNERCKRYLLNPDAIYDDEKMKYCAYDKQSTLELNIIDFIKLYRNYPLSEMCMKLKMFRLLNEKSLKVITENKAFRKYIFVNASGSKLLSFQHMYNAFKKNPNGNPFDYYLSLQDRINVGKKLSNLRRDLYEKIIKIASRERIFEYVEKKEINSSSYNDYLIAADWLHLDLSDTKVLFPNDFQYYHDEYVSQYYNAQNQNLDEKMIATANDYSFLEYTNGDYVVYTAKSKMDLINEGEKLHHCVGRMDYDERQADKKSIICFIRKMENINQPFVTVEVGLDKGDIKQCYGLKDSVVTEIDDFKKEWTHYYRKHFREQLSA